MKVANKIQLFVVEDDKVQAQILFDKMKGFVSESAITHFVSGEDLLSFISEHKKSDKRIYLILDYFLQTEANKNGLNGIDIIKQLQVLSSNIKVVIFSAYENDDSLKFDTLVNDHDNVIGAVKKSDFAFSTLQNIIRFDFINKLFRLKRKRFVIMRSIFIAMSVAASLYLIIANWL